MILYKESMTTVSPTLISSGSLMRPVRPVDGSLNAYWNPPMLIAYTAKITKVFIVFLLKFYISPFSIRCILEGLLV